MDQVIQSWEWIKAVMALRDPDVPLSADLVLDRDAQALLPRLQKALEMNSLLDVDGVIQEMEEFIFYSLPVREAMLPPFLAGRTAGRSFTAARTRTQEGKVPAQVRRRRPDYRRFQAIELGLHAVQALVQTEQFERADSLAERLFAAHALSLDPGPAQLIINRALEESARALGIEPEAQMARQNAEDRYCQEIRNRANYDSNRTFFRRRDQLFSPVPLPPPPAPPSPPDAVVQMEITPPPSMHPYLHQEIDVPAGQQARLNWNTRMSLPIGGDAVHTLEISQVWVHNRRYALTILDNQDCVEYKPNTSYTLVRLAGPSQWVGDIEPGTLLLVDRTRRSQAGRLVVLSDSSAAVGRYTLRRRPSNGEVLRAWLRLFSLRRPARVWGTVVTALRPMEDQAAPLASLRLPMTGPVIIGKPQPGPANRPLPVSCVDVGRIYVDGQPCEVKPLRGQAHYLLDPRAGYFLVRVTRAVIGAAIATNEYLLVKEKVLPQDGDYVLLDANSTTGYDLEGGRLLRQYLSCDGRIELRPNQPQPPEHPTCYSPDDARRYIRGVVVARFTPV